MNNPQLHKAPQSPSSTAASARPYHQLPVIIAATPSGSPMTHAASCQACTQPVCVTANRLRQGTAGGDPFVKVALAGAFTIPLPPPPPPPPPVEPVAPSTAATAPAAPAPPAPPPLEPPVPPAAGVLKSAAVGSSPTSPF